MVSAVSIIHVCLQGCSPDEEPGERDWLNRRVLPGIYWAIGANQTFKDT